ncbi:MAG: GWxTD domain-containing protein [Candidatus Edwardsbacteria bacterium]|jgi:GWxTD domain-containing protein|nr:GWxTD domain-containing protein [Candidatus Edwardsbacteria bacterium]
MNDVRPMNSRRLRWMTVVTVLLVATGCATIPHDGWTRPEQKRYFELAAVGSPEELTAYEALPDSAAREDFWRTFWKRKDPTPTTERNERYEEHLARVGFADENFPASSGWWDDRGKIYLKFGDPDDREWNPMGSAPSQYMCESDPTSETGSAMVSPSRGWERWGYSRLGHQFTFVQQLTGYKLAKSLYSAQTFSSSIQASAVSALNELDRSVLQQLPAESYRHEYGQPLDFPFGVARFGDSLGAEVWVHYSVPLAGLDYDSTGTARLTRRIVVFDRQMREAARDDRTLTPPDMGRRIPDAQAIDLVRLRLPPGDYTLAISLEDTRAGKTGIYEYPFLVLDYLQGAKETSDLLLAREIVRDTAASKFRKGGYRIVPQPSHAFRAGASLFLYYEVYNLKPGDDGRCRAEVRYYLVSRRDKTARGTAPAVLTTDRPRLEQAAALALGGLPAGDYHAVVTARDQVSGKERTLIAPFRITE